MPRPYLPIDAIQEFNVIENPPAQYGWKPGAIVNVGLKSGTNNMHGTAYAFGRSDAFDARNYFDAAPSNGNCIIFGPAPSALCNKNPVELEQFGATVGGPIKRTNCSISSDLKTSDIRWEIYLSATFLWISHLPRRQQGTALQV